MKKKEFVLGIECTAHTFGIGIIDILKKEEGEKAIIFNKKNQFKNDVGMDPRKIQEFHIQNFDKILREAKEFLDEKKIGFEGLSLISFSQGPGLGNSLKIAGLVAKTLSLKYKIPIVGINHIKAHLEIGKMLTKFHDPLFLYVSGVNTQIIAKDEFGKYKIYGETEDIGLGNLIDSFARLAGLDFPGGPIIEKLAKKTKHYIEMPYNVKGMNISLAGIFSFLKQQLKKGVNIEELSYSLQETTFAELMEIAERAMAYTNKKEFLIVGGVAANKRLEEMAKEMCKIRNSEYKAFPMEYAMDNGAMIAWEGYLNKDKAKLNVENLKPENYINIESEI